MAEVMMNTVPCVTCELSHLLVIKAAGFQGEKLGKTSEVANGLFASILVSAAAPAGTKHAEKSLHGIVKVMDPKTRSSQDQTFVSDHVSEPASGTVSSTSPSTQELSSIRFVPVSYVSFPLRGIVLASSHSTQANVLAPGAVQAASAPEGRINEKWDSTSTDVFRPGSQPLRVQHDRIPQEPGKMPALVKVETSKEGTVQPSDEKPALASSVGPLISPSGLEPSPVPPSVINEGVAPEKSTESGKSVTVNAAIMSRHLASSGVQRTDLPPSRPAGLEEVSDPVRAAVSGDETEHAVVAVQNVAVAKSMTQEQILPQQTIDAPTHVVKSLLIVEGTGLERSTPEHGISADKFDVNNSSCARKAKEADGQSKLEGTSTKGAYPQPVLASQESKSAPLLAHAQASSDLPSTWSMQVGEVQVTTGQFSQAGGMHLPVEPGAKSLDAAVFSQLDSAPVDHSYSPGLVKNLKISFPDEGSGAVGVEAHVHAGELLATIQVNRQPALELLRQELPDLHHFVNSGEPGVGQVVIDLSRDDSSSSPSSGSRKQQEDGKAHPQEEAPIHVKQESSFDTFQFLNVHA